MANNLIDPRLGLSQGILPEKLAPNITRYPIQTPNQMNAINQQLQLGQQNVNRVPTWEPYANRARTQFEQRDIPTIAQRFANLGMFRGPGIRNELSNAYANLESGLAQGESMFNQGQQQFGLQQLQLGLTPQYHTHVEPKQSNFLQQLLPILAGLAGTYFAGPAGGAGATALEQMIEKLISGMGGQQEYSQPSAGGFNIQNLMGSMGQDAPYYFGDNSSRMNNLFQGI